MASINQFGDFGATTNSVRANIPKGRSSSVGEMSVVVGPVDVFGAGARIGAIGKSLDPSLRSVTDAKSSRGAAGFNVYLSRTMTKAKKCFHNLLVTVILLISLALFFMVSEANPFQRFTIRCDAASIGSGFQKSVIRVIKTCINRNYKTSFYNMRWLEDRYLSRIFGNIEPELRELIIILNGVDRRFVVKSLRVNSESYNFHMKIVNENVNRLSQLLNQFGVEKLSDDCMKLKSVDRCYAQARKKIALPTLRKIRFRIFFLRELK